MAYDRYATQFTDKDGNVYGVMDEEARSHLALVEGGYNPDMIVGGAEHLVSKDGVVDTTLYGLRRVPDGAGQAYLEKVVGGTVAWNQYLPDGARSNTHNGVTYTRAEKSPYVLSGTATGNNAVFVLTTAQLNAQVGHKYLLLGGISSNIWLSLSTVAIWGSTNPQDTGGGKIANAIADGKFDVVLLVANGTATDGKKVIPQCFDLTQMFGPTIADAIYAMEQATAGAGVAWFRKLFPASYYAYNAGELVSVNALSRRTVGFNQWDEEIESGEINTSNGGNGVNANRMRSKNFIPIIPDATYYAKGSYYMYLFLYDENKSYIGFYGSSINNKTFTPSLLTNQLSGGGSFKNARYARFRYDNPTYTSGDVCISLSSDRNGEYEPYSAHTYPFADLTLRGIPKLENGELGYDGDTHLPDGTVTRRFGVFDLGSVAWEYYTSGANPCFIARIPTDMKTYAYGSTSVNMICSMYKCIPADGVVAFTNNANNMTLAFSTTGSYVNRLLVQNTSYTDAAAFKAAMSGVYLVYELAAPTIEQADPFNPFQILDPYGTEEFISGTIAPVGHSTRYQADMVKTMRKEIDAALICPTASGAIASFPDGADGLKLRELNVAVEPVQDLHGYDAPWPGGGGKNKFSDLWSEYTKPVDYYIHPISLTQGETYYISVQLVGTAMTGIVVAIAKDGERYNNFVGLTTLVNAHGTIYSRSFAIDGTYTNPKIAIYCNNETEFNQIFTNYHIQLELGSTSTNWTPYSNICPISGHTGAVVTRTGKNLLRLVESEMISSGWNRLFPINVKAGAYTISCQNRFGVGSTYGASISLADENYNAIGNSLTPYTFGDSEMSRSVTITEEQAKAKYILFSLRASGGTFANVNDGNIQLELGSTATAYEPYQGISVTIPFGQTVYGGNLNLHQDGSGELVVDRAIVTATRNNVDIWKQNSPVFRILCSPKGPYISGSITNKIANCLPTVDNNRLYQGLAYGVSEQNEGNIGLAVNGVTTLEAMSDWVEANNLQVCYKLATPVSYTLTASQITTLLGHNNIWADCGDVSVTYPADTKLYIDGQQTEDDMTANANIPNGYYFQVGNTLYKATAAIAQGETIIPGTNCTRTTFAEALNLLAAQ